MSSMLSQGRPLVLNLRPEPITSIIRSLKLKFGTPRAGSQEKYAAFASLYHREAKGVLLVYDITNHSTFENVELWLKKIRESIDANNVVIMLVGNKSDLEDSRQVSIEEGKSFAEREQLLFIETSALDATNIEEGFTIFLNHIYNNVTSP
ncbi:Small GTPase [Arabidopsis suecica]|uniref:Small GTPase n=1 Tax=Arabidopsis suecica TaxID=45249 RepID=A0A8T1XNJ3_ARASU|nr:Small GTPase [Arabidopsis suecica]